MFKALKRVIAAVILIVMVSGSQLVAFAAEDSTDSYPPTGSTSVCDNCGHRPMTFIGEGPNIYKKIYKPNGCEVTNDPYYGSSYTPHYHQIIYHTMDYMCDSCGYMIRNTDYSNPDERCELTRDIPPIDIPGIE